MYMVWTKVNISLLHCPVYCMFCIALYLYSIIILLCIYTLYIYYPPSPSHIHTHIIMESPWGKKEGKVSFHTLTLTIVKEGPSQLLHSLIFFFFSVFFYPVFHAQLMIPLRMWGGDSLCNNSVPCVGKRWHSNMEVWHLLGYKRKAGSLSCTWAPVIASSKSTKNLAHSKRVDVAFCGY